MCGETTSLFLRIVRSIVQATYLYRDITHISGQLACHHSCQEILPLDRRPGITIARNNACLLPLTEMSKQWLRPHWSLFSVHSFLFSCSKCWSRIRPCFLYRVVRRCKCSPQQLLGATFARLLTARGSRHVSHQQSRVQVT